MGGGFGVQVYAIAVPWAEGVCVLGGCVPVAEGWVCVGLIDMVMDLWGDILGQRKW